jgi:hypothetical protein
MTKLSHFLLIISISVVSYHTNALTIDYEMPLRILARSPHLGFSHIKPPTQNHEEVLAELQPQEARVNSKSNKAMAASTVVTAKNLGTKFHKQNHIGAGTKELVKQNQTQQQIGDADVAAEISQAETVIDTNIVAADRNIKKALHTAIVELQKELERATSKLVREMQNDTLKLNESINNSTMYLHSEIKNATANLTTQMNVIDNDVQESMKDTEDLTMLVLSGQIDAKEQQLAEINKKITTLKDDLPPPPSICTMYVDCTSCAANPQCGWCSSSSTCVPGDAVGPLYTYCPYYDYQICSGSNCITHSDCDSCLQDPFCGWCNAPSLGINKCLERPANYDGCPAAGWFDAAGTNTKCPSIQMESVNPLDNESNSNDETANSAEEGEKEDQNEATGEMAEAESSSLPGAVAKTNELQEQLVHYEQEASKLEDEISQMKIQMAQIKIKQLQRKLDRENAKEAALAFQQAQLNAEINCTNATNATNGTNTTTATTTGVAANSTSSSSSNQTQTSPSQSGDSETSNANDKEGEDSKDGEDSKGEDDKEGETTTAEDEEKGGSSSKTQATG